MLNLRKDVAWITIIAVTVGIIAAAYLFVFDREQAWADKAKLACAPYIMVDHFEDQNKFFTVCRTGEGLVVKDITDQVIP
jgi:hypothetical protein